MSTEPGNWNCNPKEIVESMATALLRVFRGTDSVALPHRTQFVHHVHVGAMMATTRRTFFSYSNLFPAVAAGVKASQNATTNYTCPLIGCVTISPLGRRDGCAEACSTIMSRQAQRRGLAQDAKKSHKQQGPKRNEERIAAIMEKFPNVSSENVQIRLVMEELVADKRTSSARVVSLSAAIQTAVEQDLDLIEIALHQEIPVIKAMKLSSLVYREKKKQSAAKPALARKEFSFKVVIGDNDLMRQVDRMKQFMEKGHQCLIRVRCPGWMASKDESTISKFLDRVLELLQGTGEPLTKPEFNEMKTHVKIIVHRTQIKS